MSEISIYDNIPVPTTLFEEKTPDVVKKAVIEYIRQYRESFGKICKFVSYDANNKFIKMSNLQSGVSAARLKQLTRMMKND